ncbi:MAG TPA: DMT family transporter [Anaerolineales bacterium]|jgi:drug/metabolite transporter (DMT)-like permease|nr:DMT family transporter [Anaerolineales bacterium]
MRIVESEMPRGASRAVQVSLAALFAGAIAIAFAPIFVRLSQVGPTATAFWRVTLALPALWSWAWMEERGASGARQALSRRDYGRLILAGLFFAGDLGVWHWSIKFTSVANATLLANFAPVFVTLGSWLIFKQRVAPTFLVGMVGALAGTVLIVGVSVNLSMQHLLGDGLGLVTAVFYGGYILSVKNLRSEFSTATVMAWASLVTAIVLLPVTLLFGEGLLPVDMTGWEILLGLALLSQVGGQGLIAFALAHLPASFSSVTLLVQPVMATVFAWLILSETITPLQGVGGVLVLAGIFVARRASA